MNQVHKISIGYSGSECFSDDFMYELDKTLGENVKPFFWGSHTLDMYDASAFVLFLDSHTKSVSEQIRDCSSSKESLKKADELNTHVIFGYRDDNERFFIKHGSGKKFLSLASALEDALDIKIKNPFLTKYNVEKNLPLLLP